MNDFDNRRLSVTLLDVEEGKDLQFLDLMRQYAELVEEKGYGSAEIRRDEAMEQRYYSVRYWNDASSAAQCHADSDIREVTSRIDEIATVTYLLNGALQTESSQQELSERRVRIESDRRSGFDRRFKDIGRPEGDRRLTDRRLGQRRLHERGTDVDLIGAARHAREHADAAYSNFKVGAALQTADGAIITGCNIENATYGLTICAERVAMFKALSDGHRAFTRIAVVADTESPTPPCGACRQILWEFGGNLDVVLANLTSEKGTHKLQDLLPLPFDGRFL